MVDVSNKQNSTVIKVTGSNGNTNITASSDTAQYWSKQSRLSAENSKESAQESKHYAELANSYIEGFEGVVTNNTNNIIATSNDYINQINNTANEANTTINTNKTNAINEINTTKNSAVSSVNTTKTSAITEINNTKTTAVNAVNTSKNEALNAIANAGVNDLVNKDLSNLSATGQAKFDEKVDVDDMVEINLGNSFELFDTKLTDHVLTYEETKGWALQGTYVYKSALAGSRYGYPDFYNKVLEEYNQSTTTETVNGVTVKVHSNGHKFYNIADKTAIDEFFNTMGTAWFYGVDTTNERIFLPRNNYFDQATDDISEVGQSVNAGLPNLTGTFVIMNGEEPTGMAYRAYTWTGDSIDNIYNKASGPGMRVGLDASLLSPIFGNSDTVQPNTVKKLLYICVGNTTNYEGVTEVVNQGIEILEQINEGFVPKDSMTDLSPIVDGQFVSSTVALTTTTTAGTETIDLSDYLPNDGYDYMVLFSSYLNAHNSSMVTKYLQTDLMVQEEGFNHASTYAYYSKNTMWLPVGKGRYIKRRHTAAPDQSSDLVAYGYRRMGTNS